MKKSWKSKNGFIALLVGILVMLFVRFYKGIDKRSKTLNKRIHAYNIQSDFGEGSYVTNDITTAKTTTSNPCTEIPMPTLVKEDGHWQPVHEDLSAFVFSAYFIHENQNIIIIAIRRLSLTMFCQLWYKREGGQYTVSYQMPTKVIRLPEGHGHPYSAALFECPLPSSSEAPPSYVSIVDKNCTAPLNIMLVQHVTKPETAVRNFTVCLPMLYGNPSIYRIVEWIEFNRLLGADHFFVYKYFSNSNLDKVLEFYTNKGFLTVINWNLPESKKEAEVSKPISVHFFGQVASLNDCLYRNKYDSEFIVNVDLDEFIIPRVEKETTWYQMLSHVKQNEAAYIVRNTFFKVEWDNTNVTMSNESLVEKYKLITLQKLQHEKKIFSPGLRSKYFARTSRARSLMIHTVSGVYNFPLPVNVALIHHYRDFETKDDLESDKVLDRTVPNKFGDDMIKHVMAVWSELNKTLTDNVY